MKHIENIAQLPFVVANHPPSYAGLDFLTAVQLLNSHEPVIGIVDNVDNKNLKLFMVDLCEQEGINVDLLLQVTNDWFINHRNQIPLSFYLSRHPHFSGLASLYRSIPLKNIIRVIGPIGIFPMGDADRSRKRKHIPIVQVNHPT